MSWARLNNFEYAGYIADVDAHLVPPNVASCLKNAHCDDGVLERYKGFVNFPIVDTLGCRTDLLSSATFHLDAYGAAWWVGDDAESNQGTIQLFDDHYVTGWADACDGVTVTVELDPHLSDEVGIQYSAAFSDGGAWSTLTTATSTEVVVTLAIPVDTPSVNTDFSMSISRNVVVGAWRVTSVVCDCTTGG